MRRAIAIGLSLALGTLPYAAGCDVPVVDSPLSDTSGASAGDAAAAEPALTLGGGEEAYVEAADGEEAVIYFGAQGGTHLFGSIRMVGLDPGDPELANSNKANPQVHYRVETLEDGETVAEATLRFPFTPVEGETDVFELVGLTMFLDGKTCGATAGGEVLVTVDVVDADDVSATDSATWVAVMDPETCPDYEPAEDDVRGDDG